MSKIYEALLRAEMDRVAQLNQNANSASKDDSEQESPRTEAQAGTDPYLSSDRFERRLPAEGALLGDIPHVNARVMDWHPDENRLPALQAKGPSVEQLRVLRSRIHELRFDRKLKSVLVSSALPEEGKSFVSANLAVSLAKYRNSRVLLIDGDMRRGTLHKLLGTTSEPGLTEFLSGAATLDQIMQQPRVSQSSLVHNLASLTFIPCGGDHDNAADLSGNGNFERLLQEVSDLFDWIIVDSSPVTLVSDGTNLARHCDGVVYVARSGSTRYEVAQRALNELKAAQVIGVVLNAAEVAPQLASYYGYGG